MVKLFNALFKHFNHKTFTYSIGNKQTLVNKVIGWPPLIICGPSGSGKVRFLLN